MAASPHPKTESIRKSLAVLAQSDAKVGFSSATLERNKSYASIYEALDAIERELATMRTVTSTAVQAAVFSTSGHI
jgi:mannitol/fructose-specific phosphotransferase system IIA component (Ntr-type)